MKVITGMDTPNNYESNRDSQKINTEKKSSSLNI
jgi:hypothetical protein